PRWIPPAHHGRSSISPPLELMLIPAACHPLNPRPMTYHSRFVSSVTVRSPHRRRSDPCTCNTHRFVQHGPAFVALPPRHGHGFDFGEPCSIRDQHRGLGFRELVPLRGRSHGEPVTTPTAD